MFLDVQRCISDAVNENMYSFEKRTCKMYSVQYTGHTNRTFDCGNEWNETEYPWKLTK